MTPRRKDRKPKFLEGIKPPFRVCVQPKMEYGGRVAVYSANGYCVAKLGYYSKYEKSRIAAVCYALNLAYPVDRKVEKNEKAKAKV